MSYDINHCCFSGEVAKFKRFITKTGVPMVSFQLECCDEEIEVISFRKPAKETKLTDGDRARIVGRLQFSEWTIVADKIEILPPEEDFEDDEPVSDDDDDGLF